MKNALLIILFFVFGSSVRIEAQTVLFNVYNVYNRDSSIIEKYATGFISENRTLFDSEPRINNIITIDCTLKCNGLIYNPHGEGPLTAKGKIVIECRNNRTKISFVDPTYHFFDPKTYQKYTTNNNDLFANGVLNKKETLRALNESFYKISSAYHNYLKRNDKSHGNVW